MFSAAQLKENEEATVTQLTTIRGAPWSDHGLGWNRFSALVLLHEHSITWVSIGDVKIYPMRVKYWVKMPKILQNILNNHTQAEIENRSINSNLKNIILLKSVAKWP